MPVRNLIKKILLGSAISQEYICLALEEIQDPLKVTLSSGQGDFFDVTATHVFLGYKPLVIGIQVPRSSTQHDLLCEKSHVCLSFHTSAFTDDKRWRGFETVNKSVARLILQKKDIRVFNNTAIFLYEGAHGEHHLVSKFSQRVAREKEKRRRDKKTNINLSGNLSDQVQIAYSIPRIISIITLSDGSRMNMFPTDLHGPLTDDYYIGSLRVGGKASQQVEACKRIVVSDVDVLWYKQAYALGKNHMQEFKEIASFALHKQTSRVYSIPLPAGAIMYREMQVVEFLDLGIHRIFFYRIAGKEKLETSATLAHIHRLYNQWRINNNLSTKVYLR